MPSLWKASQDLARASQARKRIESGFYKILLTFGRGSQWTLRRVQVVPFPWSTLGSTYTKAKWKIRHTESGGRGCTFRGAAGVPRPPSVFLQPRIKFAAGAWKREEEAEGRRHAASSAAPRSFGNPRYGNCGGEEGGSKKKLSRGRQNGNGSGESRKRWGIMGCWRGREG